MERNKVVNAGRATPRIEQVEVSESSRNDAHRSNEWHLENQIRERAILVERKRELEQEMACKFSRLSFLKAQAKVRECGGHTIHKWIARKTELEDQKNLLRGRILDVEKDLARVSGKTKEFKKDRMNKPDLAPLLASILRELQAIRLDLRERSERNRGAKQ